MKSKIFELYKPRSLEEFLQFKKENPKETFVYVLQHPPSTINILSASDFGYLVICLPEKTQMVFSISPFVRKMKKNLQNFEPRDFILCIGDPAIIGLSTYIVGDNTGGLFNMLKWDRQERRYFPLTVDANDKLITGRMPMSVGGLVGPHSGSHDWVKDILEDDDIIDVEEYKKLKNKFKKGEKV